MKNLIYNYQKIRDDCDELDEREPEMLMMGDNVDSSTLLAYCCPDEQSTAKDTLTNSQDEREEEKRKTSYVYVI